LGLVYVKVTARLLSELRVQFAEACKRHAGTQEQDLHHLVGDADCAGSPPPPHPASPSTGAATAAPTRPPGLTVNRPGILHGCLKTHTPYDEHTAWSHHMASAA
jgi:hypothetical protein